MATQARPVKVEEKDIDAKLARLSDWKRDGDSITRTWKFKGFREAKAFVDKVADAANEMDHHPDIHIESFNTVRLVLSTHSVGGLSENDFALAGRIDRL